MADVIITRADLDGDGVYLASESLVVDGDLRIAGGLGVIKIRGYVEAAGRIVAEPGTGIQAGRWIQAGGSIQAGGEIEAGGSIEAGGGIEAGEWISADRGIVAGGGIKAGEWIKAGGGVKAGQWIDSGRWIQAGESIQAGVGIRAGWSIAAGGGIEAGERIEAGDEIDAGTRISAGISPNLPEAGTGERADALRERVRRLEEWVARRTEDTTTFHGPLCGRCGHPREWHRLDDSTEHDPTDPDAPFRCLGYDCEAEGPPPPSGRACSCPDWVEADRPGPEGEREPSRKWKQVCLRCDAADWTWVLLGPDPQCSECAPTGTHTASYPIRSATYPVPAPSQPSPEPEPGDGGENTEQCDQDGCERRGTNEVRIEGHVAYRLCGEHYGQPESRVRELEKRIQLYEHAASIVDTDELRQAMAYAREAVKLDERRAAARAEGGSDAE